MLASWCMLIYCILLNHITGYVGLGGAWLVYACTNGKGRTETATFDSQAVDMKLGYFGGP